MHVYFTTDPQGRVFSNEEQYTLPHFVWDNITFGDWAEHRTIEYEVKLPEVSSLMYAQILHNFATNIAK